MKNLKNYLWIFTLLLTTCTYDLPEPAPDVTWEPGTSDLQRIVVLGSSIGAGVMDGALYTESQQHSIGALLANQINSINPEPIVFQQPVINSENGFDAQSSISETMGKSFLKFIDPGSVQLFKESLPGELPQDYNGPVLNNLSIPYLRAPQISETTLSDNPFFQRIASNPGTSLLIDQVIDANPSVVILQLGWDDILPYATNGLTGNADPDPNAIGSTDLTPVDLFQQSIQQSKAI